MGHFCRNVGIEGKGELLDDGLAGEERSAEISACNDYRGQRWSTDDGHCYPVLPHHQVQTLAVPVSHYSSNHEQDAEGKRPTVRVQVSEDSFKVTKEFGHLYLLPAADLTIPTSSYFSRKRLWVS